MIEKYTILDRSMLPETLVSRAAYNSRIGVPAELLANKSIHDVTVRS
jgi:UDP-N-acetylmuramyl pentapeptide synthase